MNPLYIHLLEKITVTFILPTGEDRRHIYALNMQQTIFLQPSILKWTQFQLVWINWTTQKKLKRIVTRTTPVTLLVPYFYVYN
jgi:hypothetical protein